MVGTRFPGEARVDDDPHARHRQGRLRHRGRQHDPAYVGRPGEHRVLHDGRGAPVHLEHLCVDPGELPGHPRDLPDTGQEAEHVPLPFREGPPYGRRHMRQQRRIHAHPVRRLHRPGGRRPDDLHRVRDPLGLDDRRIAQQPRPPLRVRRRRGGHQPQIGPDRLPYVEEEGGHRVGVQMALMALVDDHHVDPGQLLVPLEPLEQHPGGHDLHHGVPPDHALPAHGEADPPARLLPEQPGHPPGRRPRGDPARLGDHDPAHRSGPGQPGQDQRYEGRLAGAGRGAEDGDAPFVERALQGGDGGADGETVQGFGADHAPSVVRALPRAGRRPGPHR